MSTNEEGGPSANDSSAMDEVVSFIKSHPGEVAPRENGRCMLALMAILPTLQVQRNAQFLERSVELSEPWIADDTVHSMRQCGQLGCATTCELVLGTRRNVIEARPNATAFNDCVNL